MKKIETIIIGGGISGIGCALKLRDNQKDFLMITENIGGRISTSKDRKINYGAYYVTKNYKHVKGLVKIKKKISKSEVVFHKNNKPYTLFHWKALSRPLQLFKLCIMLYHFNSQYERFKKQAETIEQKKLINSNEYLKRLYNLRADKFVKKNHIEEITTTFFGETLRATTFASLKDITAFGFLHYTLPLIIPTYKFEFKRDEVKKKLKKNLVHDTVVKITHTNYGYKVRTKKREYVCKNLVVATPPWASKRLLKLNKINKEINAYMYHIKGELKEKVAGGEEVFEKGALAISNEENGSFLIYSKDKNPNLDMYFKKHVVLSKKHWEPAFVMGNQLLKTKLDKGLYMIGDHNVVGLEDSFISGIYAANQIIRSV